MRELDRVADEEDRGVVAHQIPVAFFGVELQGEATRVADRVGRAVFERNGREAGERFGRGALLQRGGLGELADVLGDLEDAEGAAAFGVGLALGDALAVEVRHLVDEMVIVQQDRAVCANGQRVAVAGRRRSGRGGREFTHDAPLKRLN